MPSYSADDVVIIGACRTPIGSLNGSLSSLSAHQLGAVVCREVVRRAGLKPEAISEVIMGQVLTAGAGQNPARQAAIDAGVPVCIPAMTVNMVCGSGLKAVCLGAQSLLCGSSQVVLCGGQESMSKAPHLCTDSRSSGFKLGDVTLKDSILADGLTDAFKNGHMGITAENIARKYNLSREEQDTFAASSQHKYKVANDAGHFKEEIIPVQAPQSRGPALTVSQDEHPRSSTTTASLAALRTAFLKDDQASVTAGNSSGINDGAAALLITKYGHLSTLTSGDTNPLCRIVSWAQTGCDPALMGLGPVAAVTEALKKAHWTIDQVDLFELNEAFAAQSLAVLRDLKISPDRVNVNGGAIALGHPIGASGARILVTLAHSMVRRGRSRGVAALCVGGGMGIAVCVERLSGDEH